ncbi:MAG: acyl-CoA dehydrogenase family protein [Dehalococcoidia bacterium]
MDFNLTEKQRLLQTAVGEFTRNEVEPVAGEIDKNGRLPDEMIKKLAALELFGMSLPGQYGGGGTGVLDCALAIEQLAYAGTGVWWLVAFNNSIPESIAQFGSESLKEKVLKSFCDGSAYASIQFTEEDTGSDADALVTRAVPEGDNYLINGMKRLSTFGARDGYAVLYTKDETELCTAFVVRKKDDGYRVEKEWELMGGGGMESVDVYFENMRVNKDDMLGQKGEGFKILLYWIALEKIMQCSANVGMAQAALDEAINYANSRISRGKPVSSMQGIRWMFADMKSKLEAARWITYRSAFLYDQRSKTWQNEAAAAKLFVIPVTMEIIETARQIHGAYGYIKDFKIERISRAAVGAASIATSLEINKSIVGGWVVR